MPVTVEHVYKPRGACRVAMLKARDPEVLISGPAGTGKSRACLEKLNLMCLLNPGMRGLIVRKTATSLSSTALVTWKKFVIKESLAAGDVRYYGGSASEPAAFLYRNGSSVSIAGMDKPTKVMSSEYDLIYVQEATELTETDWESLISRLRNWQVSFQQILADCNPSHPTHWLKQRCDIGKTRMLESRHEDNPLLYGEDGTLTDKGEDYINGKLDKLTGVRKLRLRYGRWASAEGIIYEDWSADHIVTEIPAAPTELKDPFGVPVAWPRIWSVDFGFVNPFVLQCWAEDPDGRMYLYRELYYSHRTVDVHAAQILDVVAPKLPDGRRQWLEPQPVNVVCDHDAEGRTVLERELELSTSPAHKSVLEGIEAVQVRMKDPGDGRPRLLLLAGATLERDPYLAESGKPTSTVEEIPGYVWRSNTKKGDPLDEPLKSDDHGCDAMRYAVAERDFGVRAIYRTISAGVY
jgi:PBSX family phage terminase large subunit